MDGISSDDEFVWKRQSASGIFQAGQIRFPVVQPAEGVTGHHRLFLTRSSALCGSMAAAAADGGDSTDARVQRTISPVLEIDYAGTAGQYAIKT